MATRRGKRTKRHTSAQRDSSRARLHVRDSATRESRRNRQYRHACELVAQGQVAEATRLYESLREKVRDAPLGALIVNDLAALTALDGDVISARKGFQTALALNPDCRPARLNLALVEADVLVEGPGSRVEGQKEVEGQGLRVEGQRMDPNAGDSVPQHSTSLRATSEFEQIVEYAAAVPVPSDEVPRPVKVAILSFLFNWPSTGGGIVHTVELAVFLRRAGYDVKHFYVRHLPWGVGKVEGVLPFPSEAIDFDAATWNVPSIQDRVRRAVDSFQPDYVIITDSWNSKPILAEAVRAYPYLLRFQAMTGKGVGCILFRFRCGNLPWAAAHAQRGF